MIQNFPIYFINFWRDFWSPTVKPKYKLISNFLKQTGINSFLSFQKSLDPQDKVIGEIENVISSSSLISILGFCTLD